MSVLDNNNFPKDTPSPPVVGSSTPGASNRSLQLPGRLQTSGGSFALKPNSPTGGSGAHTPASRHSPNASPNPVPRSIMRKASAPLSQIRTDVLVRSAVPGDSIPSAATTAASAAAATDETATDAEQRRINRNKMNQTAAAALQMLTQQLSPAAVVPFNGDTTQLASMDASRPTGARSAAGSVDNRSAAGLTSSGSPAAPPSAGVSPMWSTMSPLASTRELGVASVDLPLNLEDAQDEIDEMRQRDGSPFGLMSPRGTFGSMPLAALMPQSAIVLPLTHSNVSAATYDVDARSVSPGGASALSSSSNVSSDAVPDCSKRLSTRSSTANSLPADFAAPASAVNARNDQRHQAVAVPDETMVVRYHAEQ